MLDTHDGANTKFSLDHELAGRTLIPNLTLTYNPNPNTMRPHSFVMTSF